MKTKLFTLFFALVASVGTMSAWTYTDVQIGDLVYYLDDVERIARVTSHIPNIQIANIPSSVTYNEVTYKVTSIGGNAFLGTESLISIIIGENIDSIGSHCFTNCSQLTSIVWNARKCADFDIYSSPYPPFSNDIIAASISSFTIGENVQYIPAFLFYSSEHMQLDSIICLGIEPPSLGTGALRYSDWKYNKTQFPVYVPCGSASLYKLSSWSSYNIQYRNCDSEDDMYYWVMFNDWDRKRIDEQIVEKGHAATPPANPSREGYTFIGWDKDFSNVQDHMYIYAQYIEGEYDNVYIVTFLDWDGTILKKEYVGEGQSATAPANPSREGYTFTGWDKNYNNVQSDLIVMAQYTPNTPGVTYYTVTFKDWDGTILDAQQVEEGHSATAPANPTREGYTFAGWDKDFSNIQSDLIVTALYQKNETPVEKFTVAFKDWNGTTLKTEQVEKGQSATAPAIPTREGYIFTGWDKDFSNIQSDLIVTAQYKKKETPMSTAITVSLKASSASSWSQVNLYYWGDGVTSPNWPGTRLSENAGWYSYTFDESVQSVNIIWNDGSNQTTDINNVTTSTCYSLNSTSGTSITVTSIDCPAGDTYYVVTFIDWNGTVLKIDEVKAGTAATAPANPTREGYTFTGWDKDFSNVQSDLIVTAQYTQNVVTPTYYTVTFKDWDGTVLKTQQVEKGHAATAPASPTREGYTFTGWDKDFSNVQSDLVVTAQYTKIVVDSRITVRLNPASAWSKVHLYAWTGSSTAVHGDWPGDAVTKDADGWWAYTFPEDITNVNIIWNNGSGAQSVDITGITTSTCYELNGKTGTSITVNEVDCDNLQAIDEIIMESDAPQKVLRNGQIFILRGDKVYTVDGREVR